MIFNKIGLFLIIAIFWVSTINAQSDKNKRVNSYYGNWSIGLGINAVNDSGTQENGFFKFSDYWHVSRPVILTGEYYFNNLYSVVVSGSLNKYAEGKIIDNTSFVLKDHEPNYLAVDAAARVYLGDFFSNYTFDPYAFIGAGYTNISAYKATPFEDLEMSEEIERIPVDENGNFDIPSIGRITLNGGIGFNYWFADSWGFNTNLVLKWGMSNGEYKRGANIISNQIQLSIGVTYFLSDIGNRQFRR